MEQKIIQSNDTDDAENEIVMSENGHFSKEEFNTIIKKSTELMKDFKVYIALLAADSKKQFARIEKEEYDKLQKQKYVGSERENKFFENLPDNEIFVDSRTFVLTKDNIGLGFYPAVWNVLSLEQKIALCRLARLENEHKDFTEFVQYDICAVIMKETGALNICSLLRKDLLGHDFLASVYNTQNKMKDMHYLQKSEDNKNGYKKLTDFKSLEELRYICPFNPADWDHASPKLKALYYDNIRERRYRRAEQKAIDIIRNDAADLEGLIPLFDEYITKRQNKILHDDLLVLQELGTSRIKRDEEYLKYKVDYFNSLIATEYNKKIDAYNEKLQQMEKAEDMLETYRLREELKKMSKELDKQKPKYMTYEKARKHFANDFKEKQNKTIGFKTVNVKKNSHKKIEGYEKMN